MIRLTEKKTGTDIGELNEDQLQFLIDQLEEESAVDQDYAITPMTLDYFETQGADRALVMMLRQALGQREEMSIRWERDDIASE